MSATKTAKRAYAKAVAGNLFNVSYSDIVECDGPVPFAYLQRLADGGYTVEVTAIDNAYTLYPPTPHDDYRPKHPDQPRF